MATFANQYAARGYDAQYGHQIDELVSWLRPKLHVDITVTSEQRKLGVDAIPEWKEILEQAHRVWLKERFWDLSNNQLSLACFYLLDERRRLANYS